jgi:SAM-dependent methyltransferase
MGRNRPLDLAANRSTMKAVFLAGVPERFRPALADTAAGLLPVNVGLMRLHMEATSPEETGEVVRLALRSAEAAGESAKAERLQAVERLRNASPKAWKVVRSVLSEADHAPSAVGTAEDKLAHWRRVFDRLAATEPEAGTALYALGSPDLLSAATGEVVQKLQDLGLLAPDRDMLEIGCGLGRFVAALAPSLRRVTGIDLSAAMVAEARRRSARLGNVAFEETNGRDLGAFPDATFDIVLAADVFPYLVAAGESLAADHVVEATRVLRPAGALVVFNYSYRGDPARDETEFAEASRRAGLRPEPPTREDFAHWDAVRFLARKPATPS